MSQPGCDFDDVAKTGVSFTMLQNGVNFKMSQTMRVTLATSQKECDLYDVAKKVWLLRCREKGVAITTL